MGSEIDSDKLSSSLEEIQEKLENLRTRSDSDPGTAEENLSDACNLLQVIFGELLAANEVLSQQKEELIIAQETIKQGKDKLSLAQRAAGAGIWDWDIATNHIEWSSELFGLFGLDQQKCSASFEAWNSILHPDDRQIANFRIEQALREHTSLNSEYRIVRPDRQIRWINAFGQGKYDDKGRPVRMIGICIDVTDRKRTEESLLQSQSMLAQAEKIGNIGSWMWNIRSGELIWSEQTYRIFGMEPGRFVPTYESFLAQVHPDYRQLMEQAVKSALSGDTPFDVEYQIITSGSITRWVQSRGEVVFDEMRRPISMVGTALDTTERKLMEIALQESEEKFRLVADFTYDWETWRDPNGNYIYVSPSCERITGHDAENFLKDPQLAVDIVHPDDKAAFKDHLNAYFKDQICSGQIDYRIVTKKGETRWISHLCQPVFGRNGEWLGHRASNRDITERKQADEALRESEERYRGLTETARDIIVLLSTDGTILSLNPAFETITGWSRIDWIGKHFGPIVHPDDLPIAVETFGCALNGENPAFEVRFIGKSGEHIPVEAVGAPQWVDGKIIGVQAIARDITERRKAEEELRKSREELELKVQERTEELSEVNKKLEAININLIDEIRDHAKARLELQKAHDTLKESEQRFHAAIDNFPDIFAIYDRDLKIQYINHAGIEKMGLSEEQIVGHTNEELFPPSSNEICMGHLWRVLETKTTQTFEATYILPSGSSSVIINYVPLLDKHGQVNQILGITYDITERKRFEDDLRRSEAKNRALLDAIPDAMFLISEDGAFLDFRADESGLYVPPKDFIGKKIQDVLPPYLAKQSMYFMEQAKKTGELQVYEYQLPMAKGPADYEARITLSGDDSFLAVIRNITDRKRSERMLLKAKEAAEAALRVKSEFLAVMSHELRTPLNGVLGMASLLDMENLSSEQRECVDIIRSSSESLLTIVSDILDFTTMESGKVAIDKQPFNLRRCLNDVVNLLSPKAKAKSLDLACYIDKGIPETIISDQVRLRQVLTNLLDNAAKFTDNGRIDIFVSGRSLGNGKQEVFFSVRDTGIGISPENISKLFQPFSQVDMSTSRQYGGTGLGLAISRQLVELMGGKISVKSEVGKGSTFNFTIIADEFNKKLLGNSDCLDSTDSPEQALNLDRSEKESNSNFGINSCRVLLAEDNEVNQFVTLRMLKKLGYTTDAVSSGREAIESLKRHQYDIILMDVQMHDTDGLEATKEIRRLWPDRGMKIIALTAHALKGDRERCIEVGMNGYIAKPIRIGDLAEALEKYRL